MSLYRIAMQDGLLVRQKRRLLRWWCWSFNRSEEDTLIRMKNDLTMMREKVKLLSRRIPKEEARLKQKKDKLRENSNSHGQPYRDQWTARKEPVRLIEDIALARKKTKQPRQSPKPLLHITPA